MLTRRDFIGHASLFAAASIVAPQVAWSGKGTHKIKSIGIQLFTLRDLMKKDFEGTIAKVASIGYKELEFAGYFDRSPKQVRQILDKHGLKSPASHIPYEDLGADKLLKQIEAAKTIGQSYLVQPWIPEELRKTVDDWKRVAEKFNVAGETCRKAGIQFAYHNHWFEFVLVGGKLPYDLLLEMCDAKLLAMEMDLCWITVGGGDPFKYFDKYPGRFPLIHAKDLKTLPSTAAVEKPDHDALGKDLTEVGSGIVDFKKIFAQADCAGIKHVFVEHDNPKDPLASIKTSFQYLSKLKF